MRYVLNNKLDVFEEKDIKKDIFLGLKMKLVGNIFGLKKE